MSAHGADKGWWALHDGVVAIETTPVQRGEKCREMLADKGFKMTRLKNTDPLFYTFIGEMISSALEKRLVVRFPACVTPGKMH